MKKTETSNNVVNGLFWKFSERFSAQIVSFIVSTLLARLLLPEDYGSVALVLVFIDLANIFVVNGFSTALIQNKNSDDTDFSTMFFCSFGCSIILYILLFIFAENIAAFYKSPILIPVIRILSLKLPLAAINSIQHAYVSRNMLFKKFFFSTIIGTIISGIIGIYMAFKGCGVWSLVAQYLINSVIDMIVIFITIDWKPKWLFSKERAKIMMKFGWHIMIGAFADELYNQARTLIIGKKYTSSSLAYYNKGTQFPRLFLTNINSSISSVLFPAMSNLSDKPDELKNLSRKFIKIVSFVISPMMIGLFVVSPSLISVLLTDKWLECVPFLRIACIMYMLTPINTANLQAIKAIGRSDIFLKIEILKKAIGIAILVISMNFGVYVLALSTILVQVMCNLINIYPNKKLIKYGYLEQMLDIFPSIIVAVVMGIVINLLSFLDVRPILLLVIQVISGGLIYVFISYLVKLESFEVTKNIIKNRIKKGGKY